MKKYYFIIFCFYPLFLIAQEISLKNIWLKGEFFEKKGRSFRWMTNDLFYTDLKEQKYIIQYEALTGKVKDTIFISNELKIQNYQFSYDEQKILLTTETKKLYRYSKRAIYYVYDCTTQQLFPITIFKIFNPTFSKDASKVAYTFGNNLYYFDCLTQKTHQITKNGEWNKLLHGRTDWVTEEEFTFTKAFWWNDNATKLTFLSFDEKDVPVYDMQMWGKENYPTNYSFKYPKAGENNAEVSLMCYDLITHQLDTLINGELSKNYLVHGQWINNKKFVIQQLNRNQQILDLLTIDVTTKKISSSYTEETTTYVETISHLFYHNEQFLITSEQNGFNHLYWVNKQRKFPVTKGKWNVKDILYIDKDKELIYYTSTEESFAQQHLYVINFKGRNKRKITKEKGSHYVKMSSKGTFFVDYYSSLLEPLTVTLYKSKNLKQVTVLEGNLKLKEKISKEVDFAYPDLFSIKIDTFSLNGWMMKPKNMEKSKKYPVLMYVYGGPGHQTVQNRWQGANFIWYQLLVKAGYIIVSIDGRGTGGRTTAFKKCTYGQLGALETQDQIAAASYLKTLPFVDNTRVGIWGWSFGGYLSSLCMMKGDGMFKMGIAVAPVTSWRFYDSVYSERYLGQPKDNAKGYDQNSPIHFADNLKGKYLLIHGTGDDNVHYQNAIALQNALIKANKKFDTFMFPDRNHGIYGGNTRFYLYQLMTDYILKNL